MGRLKSSDPFEIFGGLVVKVLAFYSDDLSWNPAGYLNFLHEKTKINEKEAGQGLADLKKYQPKDYRLVKFYQTCPI